jgi:hypothetical protein
VAALRALRFRRRREWAGHGSGAASPGCDNRVDPPGNDETTIVLPRERNPVDFACPTAMFMPSARRARPSAARHR